jgi:hypothetical protein
MKVPIPTLAAVAVLAAGIGPVAPEAVASQHHQTCPVARHGKLVRRDRVAEVYYASSGAITGCVFASGHRHILGHGFEPESQGSHGILDTVLTGYYAAYEQVHDPFEPEAGDPSTWYIVVRDLRTGKLVHREPTGISDDPASVGLGEASSRVVSGTGAVAWIVIDRQAPCEPARNLYCAQVHVITSRGNASIVAEGTASPLGIEPASLELHHGTLSWRQGSKRKRFKLR